MDAKALAMLKDDRARIQRDLDAYAAGKRSIHPSAADIAMLEARLVILDRLIARR